MIDLKDFELEERVFPARLDELENVIAFMEQKLEEGDVSMKLTMVLAVALEEMFVNVAHYAYPDSEGDCKIEIGVNDEGIVIQLTDSGWAFDPLVKIDPDIKAAASDRPIGGLGIFMVKKSMDAVSYERTKDGKNIFTMFKRRI